MRFESNGMAFDLIILASCGSFITLALTASRCARDLNTIHENTTVSPGLSLIVRGNDAAIFVLRSSPTHSRNSRAAVFLPDLACLLRHAAVRRQIFLGNGQDISIDVFHVNPPCV